MMTKRDYVQVADGIIDTGMRLSAAWTWPGDFEQAAAIMARYLAVFNPNFDTDRFVRYVVERSAPGPVKAVT